MLVLYAAWLSLLCNLDFSCFKSLYYFSVTLVVLVCCSLPQPLDSRLSLSPLYSPTRTMSSTTREKERLKYMSTTYTVISCLVFFPHTYAHPINTTNCGVRYSNSFFLVLLYLIPITNLSRNSESWRHSQKLQFLAKLRKSLMYISIDSLF